MSEVKKTLYEIESGEAIFDAIMQADVDGSMDIDFNEFLMGTIDFNVFINDVYIKNAFDAFDKDLNGEIDHDEII